MEVIRTITQEIETEDFKIGDKIKIELKTFGTFTATVHQINEEGILFVFDNIITFKRMSKSDNYACEFKNTKLRNWLVSTFIYEFPLKLRIRIKDISIPSYEQIFGYSYYCTNSLGYLLNRRTGCCDKECAYKNYIMQFHNDKQFALFQGNYNIDHRIKALKIGINEHPYPYWLRNQLYCHHQSFFICLDEFGNDNTTVSATHSHGVVPTFLLKKIDLHKE